MRGHPRPRPQRLAAKLLEIRQRLDLSQPKLAKLLRPVITDARISEYEHGIREPNLMVLLAYSRIAKIPVEYIIDDRIDLTTFRDVLMREIAKIERK